jgi:diguanylate cyclase (GGDEF)-like protein
VSTPALPSGPQGQEGAPSPLCVLVADDETTARIIVAQLVREWGHDSVVAANGEEGWAFFKDGGGPDIALLDWEMPKLSGLELCRRIRSQSDHYVYTIMVTGRGDTESLAQAMRSGADDYIEKPVDPRELEARLRAASRIVRLQRMLQEQATRDRLTGLWNRGAIMGLLQRDLARVFREGGSLAVVLVDVDHFKSVNDAHGHLVGDEVLRETARRLLGGVCSGDAVGRYGGEEFLLVLTPADLAAGQEVAERIRRDCLESAVATPTASVRLTVSAGVAAAAPGQSVESLLQAADQALHRAKDAGRNRVEVFRTTDGPA